MEKKDEDYSSSKSDHESDRSVEAKNRDWTGAFERGTKVGVDPHKIVYKKWSKFPLGKGSFAIKAAIAGVCGSFLFGLSMGLLNASSAWIGAELWPCDPPVYDSNVDTTWKTMDLSDECKHVMGTNINFDIATKCSSSKADKDKASECTYKDKDGDDQTCTAPSFGNCKYNTWMGAILTICVLLGAFSACMMGGKLLQMGVQRNNAVAMVIFLVGAACSGAAGSIASLCVARLITGFAVGMTSMYPPMWIAQMTPREQKGAYGVGHQLLITVGILVGVILALAFGGSPELKSIALLEDNTVAANFDIDTFPKVYWRCMLTIGYLLPVLLDLGLFAQMSMDTPEEYVERGHMRDAQEGLLRVYKKKNYEEIEEYLDNILDALKEKHDAIASGLTFGKAFGMPEYRWMIFVGCMGSAIQQLSGINVFIMASNQIFSQAGIAPKSITVVSVIMTALNCLMTFPAIYLIEKLGRRTLMLAGIAGQIIGAVLPTIGMWSAPDAKWAQYMSIAGCFILVCSFATAMGPVLWVWFTEIFPLDVNLAASSALVGSNWFTGIVMVFLGCAITSNKVLFIIFLVLNIFSFIFMFAFCKETKGLPVGVSPYLKNQPRAE